LKLLQTRLATSNCRTQQVLALQGRLPVTSPEVGSNHSCDSKACPPLITLHLPLGGDAVLLRGHGPALRGIVGHGKS